MSTENIIEFNNFGFQYFTQAKPTLHNVNLTIKKGEKILIIGPSGSGKSTLGHCINGLIPFSFKGEITGSLKVKDAETKDLDIFQLSKIVGTVLQDPDGQFVGLSVFEDIAFALENDNVALPEMKERVAKAAAMVDMERFPSSSPFELSGGQKQRTSLAGVMVDDVDVLLFDEPLANLDPATGMSAIEIIDDIHNQTDKTVVIIEHRLEDVLHKSIDRIILMNKGRIIADMNADALMASSLLIDNGIREPLYVTALKYAGVEVSKNLKAGRIDTLDFGKVSNNLVKWNEDASSPQPVREQTPLLSLENVCFSYDESRELIKNVNFTLNEGELIAIVGRNGAGKSTLSRLISGFEKESSGIISYRGEDISGLTIKERAEKIGVVMQNPNQMISKPLIYDEVALGLRLRKVDEKEIEERVDKALEVCGLAPFRKWPISALSFGQRKRVTIASILVLNPEVIILDEPTAGQDFKNYTRIMEFIKEVNALGVAIILITHDMHLMLEYATRAVVLCDGQKIADAPPSEILTNSEIIEPANLKETSLYRLSQKVGIEDGTGFVQNFINYERRERAN